MYSYPLLRIREVRETRKSNDSRRQKLSRYKSSQHAQHAKLYSDPHHRLTERKPLIAPSSSPGRTVFSASSVGTATRVKHMRMVDRIFKGLNTCDGRPHI